MNTRPRRMILATFIHNSGAHPGGWRYGASAGADQHDVQHYVRLVKKAEEGKLHCYFSGDQQGLPYIKGADAYAATDYAGKLEPTTLLAALAMVTSDIGLIGTVSTTYNEPYAVARRIASLDHITRGRAGWNVVTSAGASEARNFGAEDLMDHDLRYERAEEFVDVVKHLWDSWADDAVLRDKAAGRYFDPAKLRQLNHRGRFFNVAGPLNVGRPPQGHPVIVQAGGSGPGRALSARTADMIFTAQSSKDKGQAFYADMKARATAFGRDPAHLAVIPSVQLMVRSTEAEARAAEEELLELIPDALAWSTLCMQMGFDFGAAGYGPDDHMPDIPLTNGGQWVQQELMRIARADNLTLGQLARRATVSRASFAMAGTPEHVADTLEDWFRSGAADGFSLSPNYQPGGLDDFVDQVVPILQRRGLFRTDYEGATLRDNLGLPRPANSFAADPSLGAEPDLWA
ncbi:NtaA/DmoA family FMN-dependent monooxygenase [Novosphingobium sp. FSY-8]|uniref:NtaA/DmoA family FMN-dependent monooxygenase n=1 Tax=Novosphingobium ovatum TaxID=1908523 RepID=A0ABW9XA15_9SPHN|nr:LLM class flavin-dependent oxidoreductase [Novosphingobium ovatum]NBC35362.1 NtaA/DmoA family FMN-dependent monooxygenase [Novosphingobium ovatum]